MRVSPCVLIMVCLGLPLCAVSGDPPAVDQRCGENGNNQTLIATVFGKSLSVEQLTPADIEIKRGELARGEFDEWLRNCRGSRIYQAIWRQVLPRYVEREMISVTKEELAAIARTVDLRLKSAPEPPPGITFTEAERKGIMVAWARASLMDWKVCKSLYEKYGGRVGIGSLGAWTAFGGQTALLREHHKAGEIKFHDVELEAAFWQHTRIKNFADAYPEGERLKRLLATPPYLENQVDLESPPKKSESGDVVRPADNPEHRRPDEQSVAPQARASGGLHSALFTAAL